MAQQPADEIAQLRQANLALQQQFAQFLLANNQNREAVNRRRYLDAPPSDAPDDAHLLPEDHRRGANFGRLPVGGAGNSGEPHLLDLQADAAYSHAIETGRDTEAVTYRALLSALAYQEVAQAALEGIPARLQQLTGAAPGIRDAVALAYPEVVIPAADGEAREAALARQENRARLLERLATIEARVVDIEDLLTRLTGTTAGVLTILAHGEGLARSQLAPPHLIPKFLRQALLSGEQVSAHFTTSSASLQAQTDRFRTEYAHLASKEAAKRAAGAASESGHRARGGRGGRNRRPGKEPAEAAGAGKAGK